MLTRFTRIQLIVFAIASIVGLVVMGYTYLQVPTLVGLGRVTVRMELPRGGGLYEMSNVTYRGVQIGKVTKIDLTASGAEATLSLDPSPPVPDDLIAEVRSVSAVGEQYVDLRPHRAGGPYLRDGSVIAAKQTRTPQRVGPMMDSVSALLGSIPQDKLSTLIEESGKGFDDAGFDLGSLFDSAAKVATDMRSSAPSLSRLIDNSAPLLDAQSASAVATRSWAHSVANVSGDLVANDGHWQTILQAGPSALQETSKLLNQVKPTLPVLLANMTSLGQVLVTYMPSLEQLLVLFPPYIANLGAIAPSNNATGLPLANFRIEANDPPACTVGFLPPSQWRSPADTTTADTPDGLYCKLPQDSPVLVRGARNIPCMGKPGKRAPTVQICDDDKPYVPLAMRPHVLGPSPFDPNLIAQGVPPDDRVTADQQLFVPPGGSPHPGGEPAGPDLPPATGPAASMRPATVVPSSAQEGDSSSPAVSFAKYDPRTGRYLAPDGSSHVRRDLAASGSPTDWRELVLEREYTSQ